MIQADSINNLNICPTLEFIDTSTLKFESGKEFRKPAVCGYCVHDIDSVKGEMIKSSLGHAEIFLDINPCDSIDPFSDPVNDRDAIETHDFVHLGEPDGDEDERNNYVRTARRAKLALGRTITYAIEAFARQHRQFLYSIFVIGSQARFMRWDRSGVIVTRAFDYKSEPKLLCKFLRRFGLASPEQRGYDPTVNWASADEEEVFARHIREEVAFQLDLDENTKKAELDEAVEEHYAKGRVMKMEIHNPRDKTNEYFLISRSIQSPICLAGRATRGYWSVKAEGKDARKVFFIKDTWRVTDEDLHREKEAYKDINSKKKGVLNVGTMYCGRGVHKQLHRARNKQTGSPVCLLFVRRK